MKFAHWKILANAITQNFIFRFVAEPYIERVYSLSISSLAALSPL